MSSTLHRSLSVPLCITLYIIAYASHVDGFTFGECKLHEPKHNQTKFYCYQKHLENIPQNLPVVATEIDLSNNAITAIKRDDLKNLVHLEILNISQNHISHVERGAFRNLISLTLLNLTSNNLNKITDEFFSGLTNLKVLLLEFNGNLTIDPSSFSVFSKLECVKLSGNNLRNITYLQPIFRIETLKELHIAKNNISHFQSTDILYSSLQLQKLNLSSNPISIFNITANIFPNLTSIDLAFCFPKPLSEWRVFSPDFFRNVRRLDLTGANISFEDINVILQTFNRSLVQLKMSYVPSVQTFIRNACLIPTLAELVLEHNGMTNFTETGLDKCTHLRISANSLQSIKGYDLRGLTSLTYLGLNENRIESIDAGAFDSLIRLRKLDLRSNKITDKCLTPAVFSGLPKLHELTLQNNHLFASSHHSKTPPFSQLQSLRILSVLKQSHHKSQTYLPRNLLWNLTNLESFWAQKVVFQSLKVDFFKDNTQLVLLDLSENDITFLSPDIFLPLRKLSQLYLRDCNLNTLDFIVQAKLHHLRHLQIKNNQISSVNDTVIQALPSLKLLEMRGNTFTCDCLNEGFIKWVTTNNLTQVLEANTFQCNSPPNLVGTELLKLDLHSCSVDWGFYCYISSTSVVLLTLVASLLYHFLRWQIIYAYYLFLAFLYDKKKKDPKKARFQYDAFVSYNLHDEHWVTGTLLPKLEGEQGWRLCLHHRDFQPGKFIVDNIIDGIYGSRKTICVISQHYLESEWCSREVQVASFRLFDEKKDVLILVFLEDIPEYRLSAHYRIRSLVRKRTYLRWPKAGEDTRAFWEKLRLALGTQRDSEVNHFSDVQSVL
ncbi:toll-like receptor 13 [Engraulis encrasicolus]|uniref:toll-like receptor 13 n=1 Tax=Engraulis encrasicolus TaxID=184585 RepID=UPI002FD0F251